MPTIFQNLVTDEELVDLRQQDGEVERELLTAEVFLALSFIDHLKMWGIMMRVMQHYKTFRPIRAVLENPIFRTPETAGGMPYPRTCDSCSILLPRGSFTTPSIEVVDLCPACFNYLSALDARDFCPRLTPDNTFLGDAPSTAVRLQSASFAAGVCGHDRVCTVCRKPLGLHCFRSQTDEVQCVTCYMQVERLVTTQAELTAEFIPVALQFVGTAQGQLYFDLFRGVVEWANYVPIPREQFINAVRDGIDPEELQVLIIGGDTQ